jgi:hypothetical protein
LQIGGREGDKGGENIKNNFYGLLFMTDLDMKYYR